MVPSWVDREEYPFEPRRFLLSAGSMSYVDEGDGPPLVMLHGNPYWSFEYRHLISHFRETRRCIAPDHLGFGLSQKPPQWEYLPEQHGANLQALLDSLDLEEITMVVGDWGGPIGLSYAVAHPDRIKQIVITNSWCWPVDDDWYYRAFSSFMGGRLGRRLIRKYNFFARTVVRAVFGDKEKLTPEIRRHIETPLADPEERKGCWVFPGQIVGAREWLSSIWERRSALRGKIPLIVWGMKDLAFREKELNRWTEEFPEGKVVRLSEVGHYVAEESPETLAGEIEALG